VQLDGQLEERLGLDFESYASGLYIYILASTGEMFEQRNILTGALSLH
jgi:hypothetical protein